VDEATAIARRRSKADPLVDGTCQHIDPPASPP
jgi:hypothetical protein